MLVRCLLAIRDEIKKEIETKPLQTFIAICQGNIMAVKCNTKKSGLYFYISFFKYILFYISCFVYFMFLVICFCWSVKIWRKKLVLLHRRFEKHCFRGHDLRAQGRKQNSIYLARTWREGGGERERERERRRKSQRDGWLQWGHFWTGRMGVSKLATFSWQVPVDF